MNRNLRAALTIVTAVAAGTIPSTTANAAPHPQSAATASSCGHHQENGSAYYGHCGPTSIRIRVYYTSGGHDYGCVKAFSNTWLGAAINIRWSEYVDTNVTPQCRWL
ncbi:DUF6355 family natural product biosynthesis protein [Allokutzneria sp. A3M-2-11 16]|uniref:DUF6355 family natural product biosynthesis protein n=1 Tax=Allokutzneria sp. A3M-2-11 16 TaxID=2962043 RepID=UPI0020B7899A|nr:DUF6355 family natural product biosynthesis protein [Allokutzneria sp. A3M-2-11 16]MCP3798446.1 DUF6355 family natural product biosynthesis protein [Allokutzneria sp. A3M-2-11 16]